MHLSTHLRTFVAVGAASLLFIPASDSSATTPAAGVPVTVALALEPVSRSPLTSAPASSRVDVEKYLRAQGFSIASSSNWLVTATASPARVRSSFGARLPTELRGRVAGVFGLETAMRLRPQAAATDLTAADLRSAYQVAKPVTSAAGITVATMQFSGWSRSDLATYAAATGVPMPSVTERAVGTARADVPDGASGELEVALDHQALLAAAPGAAHMIFFGANNDIGLLQVYDAVATAAERGEFDVLSISWGECEQQYPRALLTALNDALGRVVAAGRTVFAASGDDGALGCVRDELRDRVAVTFPASSPYVVGVGGTSLAAAATDGSWVESAWSEPKPTGTASSGGGFSRIFPRPSWQPSLTPADPAGAKTRMVPDIAAVADSRSGFGIFVASQGGWLAGRGTSLAAPITAGHFAAVLAATGKVNGLRRQLHPLLYANPQAFRDIVAGDNGAYQAVAGFDQVTGLGSPLWDRLLPIIATGPIVSVPPATRSLVVPVEIALPAGRVFTHYRVCESSDDAVCDTPDVALDPGGGRYLLQLDRGPSRRARIVVVGFDSSGAQFPGAAYTTYDVMPPNVSAAARVTSEAGNSVRFSWGAADPAPGVTVARYDVRITKAGRTTPLHAASGAATSWSATVQPGSTYTVAVRASDTLGNISPWKAARVVVPLDQSRFTTSAGWRTTANRAAYAGSTISSSTAGATAAIAVRGSSADLMFASGPAGGLVDVYAGATRIARIDTYSALPDGRRVIRVASWRGPSPQVLTLRVAGARNPRSRGSWVTVDGLRVNWA